MSCSFLLSAVGDMEPKEVVATVVLKALPLVVEAHLLVVAKVPEANEEVACADVPVAPELEVPFKILLDPDAVAVADCDSVDV
ncbi:hypothetical protein DFQ30_001680 [Apophysomyces sp. BC1015]|nr:hypothetical protein DFQ30_001680 [Apophysomyces sp. BC1015]